MSRSDQASTPQQLDALWADHSPRVVELDVATGSKLAVLSDLHLGDGSDSDDFRDNEPGLRAALRSYRGQGYSLILLGDVEDLWKFDLDPVAARYDATIYSDLRSYNPRPLRIFGNHDIEWRRPGDPAGAAPNPSANGFPEGVRLLVDGKPRAILVHGHQGTVDSDRGAWFSRFFVHIWGSLEPLVHALGLHPTNPAATASKVMGDYERTLYAWGKARQVVVICGHSHRAYFASRSRADALRAALGAAQGAGMMDAATKAHLEELRAELEDERRKGRDIGPIDDAPGAWYYNTGCGLYSSGITAIEVERPDGNAAPVITLAFWDRGGARKQWGSGPL